MRKFVVAALALVTASAAVATASATDRQGNLPKAQIATAKITICHKTASATNPYRRITVSGRAMTNPRSASGRLLRGHMRHEGDVVMAGSTACPTGVLAGKGGAILRTRLGAVGGASGSGTAFVRVRGTQVCYVLHVRGTTVPLLAAHIHQTSTGGNIVVPLSVPENPNAATVGCVTITQALAQSILANVADFYVNVHTTGGTVILTGTLSK